MILLEDRLVEGLPRISRSLGEDHDRPFGAYA